MYFTVLPFHLPFVLVEDRGVTLNFFLAECGEAGTVLWSNVYVVNSMQDPAGGSLATGGWGVLALHGHVTVSLDHVKAA